MNTNLRNEADVPASAAILSLAQVLRNAAMFYRSESILARELGTVAPEDYLKRCEVLYFTTYSDQAKQAGLALNRITFEALLNGAMPEAVLHVSYADLPKQWIFNPWHGWREA